MTFARYLASLVGSWRALAAPHPEASVVETDGYVAARFPGFPVLDNALLFAPERLEEVRERYRDSPEYAIWTSSDAAAAALRDAGFRRIEVTAAMVCLLPADEVAVPPVSVGPVDVSVIADLNAVPDDLVANVPGGRAYATADRTSGALLIELGTGPTRDVNVSFVATRRHRRRRGLATAVLAHALREAAGDGARTACLQATAQGTGVYRRLGFRQVGLWQEWAPAESGA